MLESYVGLSGDQNRVIRELLPGPFTIVLPSKHKVSKLLESEKGTLGIRITQYPLVQEIIRKFGKPTSATSANLSGKSPHYSVRSLLNEFPESKKKLIDLILDAGQLPRNKPSTVLDLTTPTLKVLRKGDIIWKNEQTFHSSSEQQTKKIAQFVYQKYISQEIAKKPVVVILKGDLGAGKTIFVKGIAEHLHVNNVISPTFTIYYEYRVKKAAVSILYHYDLYTVEDAEELTHLGIDDNLKPGNLLFFEWGEKSGDIFEKFKQKAKVFFIEILYENKDIRNLQIKSL
jgi:tRNA threonylcarbamoyl adenosine modification protein YjeE